MDELLKKYARRINNELKSKIPKTNSPKNLTRSKSASANNTKKNSTRSSRSATATATNANLDELIGIFSGVKIGKSNSADDLGKLLEKLGL